MKSNNHKGKCEQEIKKGYTFSTHILNQWPAHHLMNKPHRSIRKRQHSKKQLVVAGNIEPVGIFLELERYKVVMACTRLSGPDYPLQLPPPPQDRASPRGVRK